MSSRSRIIALLVALPILAGVGPDLGAEVSRAPVLRFEAPRTFDGEVGRLRWIQGPAVGAIVDWLGMEDPGPPVRVVLAPEDHPLARSVPGWVSGYAIPEENTAVLLPRRVVRYPYDDLAELFLHEMTHLLSHRAAGGAELPRWFKEGIALHAARGWTMADRRHALAAGLSGGPTNLAELEAAFGGSPGLVSQAYSLAGFLVDELVGDRGSGVVAEILREGRGGADFETAFHRATGSTLSSWSSSIWRRYRIWYRWVPFVTSGATLWLLVTALALVATVRRRQRDAAIKARWEDEEQERSRARGEVVSMPERRPEEDDDGEWIH